jgi:flagellar basal-body rod protein FlgB
MDNSTINTLVSALDFGSARMEAISNNLSNYNTPGYKRKDASFSQMLDAASGDGDFQTPSAKLTDSRQIAFDNDNPNPGIVTDSSGSMRPDGNNVDVDTETSKLAGAQIFYEGAAQLLENQFSGLKSVIAGGK